MLFECCSCTPPLQEKLQAWGRHVGVEAERITQLVLRSSGRNVDLVSKHDKRNLGEFLRLEQALELVLRLLEPRPVRGVHDEDDAVHGGEVILIEDQIERNKLYISVWFP